MEFSGTTGKAPTMPAHDAIGSDDRYDVKKPRIATIKPNEQSAVDPTQMQSTAWRALLQYVELMSQKPGFRLLAGVAT
jgi:hypothetical protein